MERKDAAYAHGILDPITATVIVSVATIEALAIWISKNKQKITIEKDETIKNSDGSESVTRTSATIERKSSDAKVVEQIRNFVNFTNLTTDEPKS